MANTDHKILKNSARLKSFDFDATCLGGVHENFQEKMLSSKPRKESKLEDFACQQNYNA